MVQRLWRGWGKPLLFATGILLGTHFFLCRLVSVQSNSMYGTLLAGDVAIVNRMAIWNGAERNDVIVFRDPGQNDRPMHQRRLLVKRVIGKPGDEVQIMNGQVLVNGDTVHATPAQTRDYMITVKDWERLGEQIAHYNLPAATNRDRRLHRWPLSLSQQNELKDLAACIPFICKSGHQANIFPFSPFFNWNSQNYGPVKVPAAGQSTYLDAGLLPLYDRVITQFEKQDITVRDNALSQHGEPLKSYTFKSDYYFVLGDNRDRSIDSRYWGFLPEDHVIGKVSSILLSKDHERQRIRWERFCSSFD